MSWWQIARLGLVQASIGAMVVLLTTTFNRVIVVELALPATIPGILVALHFAVQLVLRPRVGYAVDGPGKRRTPVILGGLVTCAVSGTAVAASLPLMQTHPISGTIAACVASIVLGAGVSAAGTPLLALLTDRSGEQQRAGAAALTWILMIAGIIVTAGVTGAALTPFSLGRLITVTACVGAAAVAIGCVALWRMEPNVAASSTPLGETAALPAPRQRDLAFGAAVRATLADPAARRFAMFVLLSMLAYSAQDLILEPFAGIAFGFTPAESTSLSGTHHGGVLAGMIITALVASRFGALRQWAAAGCLASAVAYVSLTVSPFGDATLFRGIVVMLGFANGMFAIGAIGSMMAIAGEATNGGSGLRLGVFGAAQALAYAVGTLGGAAGVDAARALFASPVGAYGFVFAAQATLFAAGAVLALYSGSRRTASAVLRSHGGMLPAALQQ